MVGVWLYLCLYVYRLLHDVVDLMGGLGDVFVLFGLFVGVCISLMCVTFEFGCLLVCWVVLVGFIMFGYWLCLMFGGCVSGFGWLYGIGGIVLWIGLLLLYFSGEFILHDVGGGFVCVCLFALVWWIWFWWVWWAWVVCWFWFWVLDDFDYSLGVMCMMFCLAGIALLYCWCVVLLVIACGFVCLGLLVRCGWWVGLVCC